MGGSPHSTPGLLPTYQNGPVWGSLGLTLLVFLRLLQGICTGGEIAAVSTYITEVGPKDSLARSMQLGLSPFRRQRAPTGSVWGGRWAFRSRG